MLQASNLDGAQMTNPPFIAIAGNIGSGKTTLTSLLAKRYNWRPYYEEVIENPYLADFYSDMRRYALPLQLRFLSHRAKDIRRISKGNESAILDRTIYEDAEVFARNLYLTGKMDERDYATYREISELLFAELRQPDIIVYLRMSVPRLLERIKERGRPFEQTIDPAYLTTLNDRYEAWAVSCPYSQVLVVNAEELDPRKRDADLLRIGELIWNALGQRDLFGKI
jgi:deoxyadenosine/deoxycytidine kinase